MSKKDDTIGKEVDTLLCGIESVDQRIEDLVTEIKNLTSSQLELIKSLKDENESLWFMVEELRSSEMEEWSKQNKNVDILQNRLDDYFSQLALMRNNKGEA